MLTGHTIVNRPPLRSGAGGFWFDPASLVLTAPEDAPLPERAEDLDFSYHSGSLHEGHHWRQLQGTTVGAFLSAIRYSAENTAWSISRLERDLRRSLRADRRTRPYRPIVALHDDGRLDHEATRGSRELGALSQAWYDHLLVYRSFLDSPVVDDIPWDRAETIGDVLSDALLLLHGKGVVREYDYESMRRLYRPTGNHVAIKFGDRRLSTTAILEAAATSNEVLTAYNLPNRDAPQSDLSLVSARFTQGLYGVAGNIFHEVVTWASKVGIGALWTFGLVCDIALNPPLPPIAPPLAEPRSWEELDPAWRFVRCCVAAQKCGAHLTPSADHADYCETISTICEAAGLADFQNYRPRLDAGQAFDWQAAGRLTNDDPVTPDGFIATPSGLSYYDYVLWASQRMWDLRASNAPLVVNSSWELARGTEQALPYALGGQGDLWFTPPFQAHGDRFRFAGGMRQPLGIWIACSNIAAAALHDLLLDTGPLHLPWVSPWLRKQFVPGIDEALDAWLLAA